jgi:hypothetical protein
VKNPKNHFRPFYSGNLLSAKPFQQELHKTIFRIFRKIFGGYRGEGSLISSTPNPNMSPSDNQLVPRTLSRGHVVGAQKSTQSRQVAKAQSQTRLELPGQIKTDSKRFKAIQTKKNTIPRHYKTYDSSINSNGASDSSTGPTPCPFKVREKKSR